MAIQFEYLTREGYDKFTEELNHLRTVRRAEIAEYLRQATADGSDISDNAGFEDAKREQSFVEGRIQHLQVLLSQAQILEEEEQHYPSGVICRNRLVTVQYEDADPEIFHIVGTAEANPSEGRISAESPLGRALLGKQAGDKVKLEAPDGALIYHILMVH
jgi:transcription elongation factor GreA